MGSILALDTGSTETAFAIVDEKTLKPKLVDKIPNESLLEMLYDNELYEFYDIKHVATEMIAGMGQTVGDEVFETVFWIGRFWEAVEQYNIDQVKIYRREEKYALAGTQKCKDKDIIEALVNRFAPNQPNYGKGTASNKGWFFGFKADIWSSYAVAVTYHDLHLTEEGINRRMEVEHKRMLNKKKKEIKLLERRNAKRREEAANNAKKEEG